MVLYTVNDEIFKVVAISHSNYALLKRKVLVYVNGDNGVKVVGNRR